MKHEVRVIPSAPRRIRLRPLFAHRWPLLALGVLLGLVGGLVAWGMFLQSGGKFSLGPSLDRGPTARAVGKVTRVLPPVTIDGRELEDVRYDVTWQSMTCPGGSFVPAGRCRVGDEVPIEVLVADPNTNRIVGGILHIDRAWLRARFWLVAFAVPGGLLLLSWLAGAFQLRRVLVHGDVAVGTIHRVQLVPLLLPQMLAVDYTFRDHHATTRHNRHQVRVHGALGARLLRQMTKGHYEDMPVLHDRALPQWNRMVLPDDFLASPQPIELAESDLS
ncbi:MAG: hypothetical protein WAT39_13060 [Planctomycetota bacterium]